MLLKKGLQKYNLISYNAVDYKRNNTPYTLINKNTYNFCKSSPIYYILFENSIKKLVKRQVKYTEKWKKKQTFDPINEAIELLKSNGYKIFKEV